MKKIYLSILLCFSGCKPQVAPTEDQSEFASIAGDVSGLTIRILKLLSRRHTVAELASEVNGSLKQIDEKTSLNLLNDLAKGIFKSRRFIGRYGNDFALDQRLLFGGLKFPLARTSSKLYKAHSWESEVAKKAIFARDEARGILKYGSYIAPKFNNAKGLEWVSTVGTDQKLKLSITDLVRATVWKPDELKRLIMSGAFRKGGSHEIIYAATKDKDGIVSIAVGVSETASADSLVLAGRKINHPQLVAFLKGGRVDAERVEAFAAGRVEIGQAVEELGEWWQKLNPFIGKERNLFVTVEHFNTASADIMHGATDFTPSFMNRVLDLMGCNATRFVPGLN